MSTMTVVIVLALLATVASLAWGIGSMAHGGDYDARHSTQLMTSRIVFQGIAVLLLIMALLAGL